ncbi:hypothetical protein A8C56_18000 [Niabella ginsenosidivorans]|uniref:DUF4350 domain-containing protein n=1 Tax=Niabella ginsenosidivorans TaxID=1176587 RepID=A0A1A9I5K5_9BACT|nr:hypothetical protein [Niabella ginsenosidivorans]ANH82615.1 hypothetical protein A8C56_18000 [Niabella ginsenosidivorans]
MKKTLPYLLGLLLIAVILLLLFKSGEDTEKKYNTYISFKKEDKNPYGTYVVYNGLKHLFPSAAIAINQKDILASTVFYPNKEDQFFVSISPQVLLNEEELDALLQFIKNGNYAFISCFALGSDVENYIEARTSLGNTISYPSGAYGPDSLSVELDSVPLPSTYSAAYPGVAIEGAFVRTNRSTTRIIGRGNEGKANFIELKKGKGALFLHLSPLTFSNYFLLYKNNISYLNQAFSLVPQHITTVIWDEYYRKRKTSQPGREDGWFTAIMKERSFRSGILLALALLLIFALLEMRRRQRFIPVIEPPRNDTLDFVKTMGLLYYEKRDNVNLAQKMSAYFQEHLRNKYHIFSKELNNDYIQEVSDKSGVSAALVEEIVTQIKNTEAKGTISDTELIVLQANIEKFYNNI